MVQVKIDGKLAQLETIEFLRLTQHIVNNACLVARSILKCDLADPSLLCGSIREYLTLERDLLMIEQILVHPDLQISISIVAAKLALVRQLDMQLVVLCSKYPQQSLSKTKRGTQDAKSDLGLERAKHHYRLLIKLMRSGILEMQAASYELDRFIPQILATGLQQVFVVEPILLHFKTPIDLPPMPGNRPIKIGGKSRPSSLAEALTFNESRTAKPGRRQQDRYLTPQDIIDAAEIEREPDNNRAIRLLKQALKYELTESDASRAFFGLGERFAAVRHYDKAVEHYGKAIISANQNELVILPILINRGVAHYSLKHYELAKLDFERAIELAQIIESTMGASRWLEANLNEAKVWLGKIEGTG